MRATIRACRRIALLVMLGLTLIGGWLYMQAPSLNELRPEMVRLLKQELKLSRVQLGDLSWYWVGSTWVYAEDVSFETEDGQVQVRHGRLDVQISSWDLLGGRITPLSINLRGGQLAIRVPEGGTPGLLAMPLFRLDLEDVQLSWRYGDDSGEVDHLNLHLDAVEQQLALRLPGANLQLDWDENMLPVTLDGRFEDTGWMPPAVRRYLHGQIGGSIHLERTGSGKWRVEAELRARNSAQLMNGKGQPLFSFDRAEAAFTVESVAGTAIPREIRIRRFAWHDRDSNVAISGQWREGMLSLQLISGKIAMATLWPWLRGLDASKTWHAWLASMHAGRASLASGQLRMHWPLLTGPDTRDWEKASYNLMAQVSGADLTLVTGEPGLTGVNATVSLNEKGLQAKISTARLPGTAGKVQGRLRIADWSDIVLDVTGRGQVDIGGLEAWLQFQPMSGLHWQAAPATSTFAFTWLPTESTPRSGKVTLTPTGTWQITMLDASTQLSGGTLSWDATHGITVNTMRFESPLLRGTFTLAAGKKDGDWHVTRLDASADGDFAGLVDAGGIPVDAAGGRLHARVSFARDWHCEIDLKAASWGHLLGAAKSAGTPYVVSLAGTSTPSGLSIARIRSQGGAPELKGSGKASGKFLLLNFRRVKTPALDTALRIRIPFDTAPLELDMQASYMTRQALPRELKYQPGEGKPWALRARLDQLTWDGALLQQVEVQLASNRQRIGRLRAARLITARLNLTHAVAAFRLPKEGVLELRELSAMLAEQKLLVTGTFTSRPEGGMRWQGFASISGDFGYMLNRLDASHKFRTGDMHALISGQGLLLPDQPWWHGLDGRLRLRVNDGRILEGGTMTKLLAAASLADLPSRFLGKHKDIIGEGMHFRRLQLEAALHGRHAKIRQLAIRASALDMAGQGKLDLEDGFIDLTMVIRPLQNLDAVLKVIPLLRDLLGGAAHSLFRKVYHVHGPLSAAKVEEVSPEEAGLAAPGLVESLFSLPGRWFGKGQAALVE